jgi:hypothetical protein
MKPKAPTTKVRGAKSLRGLGVAMERFVVRLQKFDGSWIHACTIRVDAANKEEASAKAAETSKLRPYEIWTEEEWSIVG